MKFNGQRERPLHAVSKRLRRAVLTERRTEVSTADAKEAESSERRSGFRFRRMKASREILSSFWSYSLAGVEAGRKK